MFDDLPTWAVTLLIVGVYVFVALIISWVLRIVVNRVTRRLRGTLSPESPAGKRAQTIGGLITTVGIVLIWATVLIAALQAVGVPVAPLLATAGIGGIALGFGTQNLVRDLVAGIFILSEGQYDVGDNVAVAGVQGTVEVVSLRSTVMRGLDGTRHVVSNGEIRVSSNSTRLYSRAVIRIPVSYTSDVDVALNAMRRVAREFGDDPEYTGRLKGPPTVMGVDALTDTSVELSLFIETAPGQQWAMGRELRRRLLMALREEGVLVSDQGRQ